MSEVKSHGSTVELPLKLQGLSPRGEGGIPGVTVKCADIRKNTVAKAAFWLGTDAEARKLGYRTGLDTPVVLAVNDVH